jgi:hypothetical protein
MQTVRVGAVGSRPDDREVDLLVAVLAQQPGEVGGRPLQGRHQHGRLATTSDIRAA